MTTIDYSVWDHIEVSDDEDEIHPNIDTPSLFRWRHQVRVFFLTKQAVKKKEEMEEEKEEKHQTFMEKYEKQIKRFGMLQRWDDSQKYLSDYPHLVCEETANYLVIMCIDLEVEEVMLCVCACFSVHVCVCAYDLKVDPRGCFRQFFTKIKTTDQQYQDAFNDELESFKERVRGRAKIRIEKALKEYEEEERQKRLGPGGLDPVEVYESLPAVRHTHHTATSDDLPLLQEAKHHMKRCIESGLWVPNARADEEGEKDKEEGDEPQYEEVKKEEQ
uniref:Hsp90 co-chaperone Cdc37 n=1 Tax=Sinocyclocheilus anshuiensis TaxID=1608454 RepID=A0A671LYP3_9TELE